MSGILNYLLAGALGYLVLIGLKDKEPPNVSIKFPKDGYEFRTLKQIAVLATDNKGIKSVTYIIDDEIYHIEDARNPMVNVWNPCNLTSGKHTLKIKVSDFAQLESSSETINFYISPDLESDCNGDCGGRAKIDNCETCSGGNTGHVANSDIDCNGDCFGTAIIDECEICSGGNTNKIENADLDCTNTCFGSAFLDECGVCSGGNTEHVENSDRDCNGDCFGTAIIDKCGICSDGNTDKIKNVNLDCSGTCFGTAFLDECDVCSGGNTEHIENSDKDCNGDCFGTAFLDECNVCSGGNTEHIENSNKDCNGDCFGSAFLDECEVCSEGNTEHVKNSDKDCNGDCFGEAKMDPCGGCTGGNTGIEHNQSEINYNNKNYTCGDMMFLIEMYKLKYPNNLCSTLDVPGSREDLSKCVGEYLKLGETRWDSKGRLTEYILSDDNIKGLYPKKASHATKLKYLDISKNQFWGTFPESLCDIHNRGTLRIAGNNFCPPYPDCFNNNAILMIDLEDMEKVAICE